MRIGLRGMAWGVALAATVGLGAVVPAAQAGPVIAQVSATGSGFVASGFGFSCDRRANLDDRATLACGTAVKPFADSQPLVLQATPNQSPAEHWQVRWEGCDSPATEPVCVITAHPNQVVRSVAVRAIFDDVRPPTVTAAAPVFSATVNSGVSFNVTANEPLSIAFCSVGGRPRMPCHQPQSVPEGTHTVRVVGRDRSGNTSALSASVGSVRIIDTRLTAGPATFSNLKRPTFRYATGAGAGASFECALDSVAYAPCGVVFTPPANLAEGPHTFRVRALDGPEMDRTPLVRTWTVDTVAPNTGLDPLVGPRDGEVSTLLSAAFKMSASEPASIQCRLDGAPFAGCPATRSFSNLAFGQHRFQARAIDRAGNVDATPISRTWTVLAVDNDGDGFNQRSDCNDADPGIRPGAREVAGNDTDENCDGFVAPPPRMSSTTVPNGWSVVGKRATLTRLEVKRLRSGARVEIRCIGKKCPFKRVKAKGKPKRGTLNLLKTLKGKRRNFRAGQTLEIRITAPRVIGKVVRYPIRAGKIPKAKELCLPPGTRRPTRCT
jgi:Putative metal-binding motif